MLRRPTIIEMRQHVLQLCEGRDIVHSWCRRPSQAWGSVEAEEICIAPVRSAISYATALHEIGHVLGRHQRSFDVMVRERWAWNWARANALIWTPAMEQCARHSLAWYATKCDLVAQMPKLDDGIEFDGADMFVVRHDKRICQA